MSQLLLDRAGRCRSPATMRGFHAGRPPRNKGLRYPADPPKVEEIIAVMRAAGDDAHGRRLRGLIVILWRAGLRIQEALALAEADLDRRRGALLVRRGKGDGVVRSAWTAGDGRSCSPGLRCASSCPSGYCSASSTRRRVAGIGQARPRERTCERRPSKQASGGASHPTSSGTPMPSSSRVRACRSSSSSASWATAISASRRSTYRASTTSKSSRPSMLPTDDPRQHIDIALRRRWRDAARRIAIAQGCDRRTAETRPERERTAHARHARIHTMRPLSR
jgi:hypothetical protein